MDPLRSKDGDMGRGRGEKVSTSEADGISCCGSGGRVGDANGDRLSGGNEPQEQCEQVEGWDGDADATAVDACGCWLS